MKKILIALILIICVALGLGLFFSNHEEEFLGKKDVGYPTFTVLATKEKDNVIELDTSFELTSDKDTTIDLVESSFSVTPSVEYDITAIRNNCFAITLKEDLAPNTIYNIEYKTDKAPYKWSFQTQKVFDVANFYPAEMKNSSTSYVSPSTVIEMDFTYEPNDDIENYFSITPEVKGKFSFDGRRIRFTPDTRLDLGAAYIVTLKEGYGNKENDKNLLKDKSFKFYTTINDNVDMSKLNYIYFSNEKYAYAEGRPIYISADRYDVEKINEFNISIYKYPSGESFASDFLAKEMYGNRRNLKPVDLSKLTKIADEKIKSDEFVEYSWKYAFNIKTTLQEGYYMVVARANGLDYYLPLQINNVGVMSEYFDNNLLVWVVDMINGKPLQNARVVIDGKNFGPTNKDGYYFAENVYLDNEKNMLEEVTVNGHTTLYDTFTSNSYKPNGNEYINAYIRFDRDVFKPGEKVNVWGFIKDRKNREFKDAVLKLSSYIGGTTVLQEEKITLDEFGTFTSSFDLTNYISGGYEVSIYLNGKNIYSNYFEVKDYDTSSYDIKLELDKKNVKAGEAINATVSASLFDGTPLPDMRLNYTVNINGTEYSKQIKTDARGKATFSIDTNINYLYSGDVYSSVRVEPVGIEDQGYIYDNFSIYPNDEIFDLSGKYLKNDNSYDFEIKTYQYDFSNMDDIKKGSFVNREVTLIVNKYRHEKVLSSTYFDEVTKTTKEVYRTNSIFEGSESYDLTTENGIAKMKYQNPYASYDEGEIRYNVVMKMENGKTIRLRWERYGNYYAENDLPDFLLPTYELAYDEKDDKHKVNDDIVLKLTRNDGAEIGRPYLLYMIKSANGVELIPTNDINYNLKFKPEFGANFSLKGFIFDGSVIREIGDTWHYTVREYSLSTDELKVDVDVDFDKNAYKPGEKAIIRINTKVNGKGVGASVNLSAVNREFLASNEVYNYSIANSLYNYYYFNDNFMSFSHTVLVDETGGGGGGGDGEPRSNFLTTAFFETVYTDSDGKAVLEVELPDNVTTWDVSVKATTKDYRAGETNKNLKVTLPFFVTAVMNDKYLTGESPSINLRSNGTDTAIGDEVSYEINIVDANGTTSKLDLKSSVGDYAKLPFNNLVKGTYKITVKASSKGKIDTIIKEFDVVDTFQETMFITDYDLVKGQNISIDKGWATFYFYNNDIDSFVSDLFELAYMPRIRNDQKVVAYLANNMLRKLSGENEVKQPLEIDTYKGIRLLPNSEADALLTAKLVSTSYFSNINNKNIIDYFNDIIKNNNYDVRTALYAYWGLSALKQPVLTDLKEIEKTLNEDNYYELSVLMLAYSDIGDYEDANRIFKKLPREGIPNEVYEYLTMAAFKLNADERKVMYEKYLAMNRETEYSNFVKLFRIQNELQNHVNDAHITLVINGEEKRIDANGIQLVPLSITFNDSVQVKDMTDNMKVRFLRNEAINSDKVKVAGILSKTYSIKGKDLSEAAVGDTVLVTIFVDYINTNNDDEYTAYLVEDVLPNCMKYKEKYNYDQEIVSTPYREDGQKLYFYVYKYDDVKQYIQYEAIITSSGDYVSDGVIIKDMDDQIIDYLKPENITIK